MKNYKVTENDIEEIKEYGRLEIYDENYYSWILTLDQNFIKISYGKANNPLDFEFVPFTSNFLKFLEDGNLLEKSKVNFFKKINSSHYNYRLYAI